MIVLKILLIVIIVIIVVILLSLGLDKLEMKRLEKFKKSNSNIYNKYKEAFDINPSRFSNALTNVEAIEGYLFEGETVLHSYSLEVEGKKDFEVYVLTDLRLLFTNSKFVKVNLKIIDYKNIESTGIAYLQTGIELSISSRNEEIGIYFHDIHEDIYKIFIDTINEKQYQHILWTSVSCIF